MKLERDNIELFKVIYNCILLYFVCEGSPCAVNTHNHRNFERYQDKKIALAMYNAVSGDDTTFTQLMERQRGSHVTPIGV